MVKISITHRTIEEKQAYLKAKIRSCGRRIENRKKLLTMAVPAAVEKIKTMIAEDEKVLDECKQKLDLLN